MDAKNEPGVVDAAASGSEKTLETLSGDKCEIPLECKKGKSKAENVIMV